MNVSTPVGADARRANCEAPEREGADSAGNHVTLSQPEKAYHSAMKVPLHATTKKRHPGFLPSAVKFEKKNLIS